MRFDIITIFPDIFDSYLNESILARAQKKKLIKIKTHTPRTFSKDRHNSVDDKPYGGGPGMILMFDPIARTVARIKRRAAHKQQSRVVLLTPRGRQFRQKDAARYAQYDQLILICGRYEGVDARVEKIADEKISIGPYVLSGGELPALVMIETISRLIPGVVGKQESLQEESFGREGYIEYPQYTRPEAVKWHDKKLRVPKVLLSGNHKKIKEWREKKASHS